MTLPNLVLLDRDSTLCYASSNPDSPLYYVTDIEHLVIKPGVLEAISLLRAHKIPLVMVTKQRCISKGLVSRQQVDLVNARLSRLLSTPFTSIYVEETAEDKTALYKEALAYHRRHGGSIGQTVLFDDSPREIKVAQSLGITAYDGTDLLSAVKTLLEIK